MRRIRTDYGTVLLHAVLVAALGVAFLTGLRIATEAPDRRWINLFDWVLPSESVWTTHMQAAMVIVAIAIAYAVYIARSGLKRRIALDTIRLRGLFSRGSVQLGAFNILLYWVFFVSLGALIVTGGMLYFGIAAGSSTNRLHWIATWTVPAFVVCHVVAQFRIGRWAQLLRVVRPTGLASPPPELDAGELLVLLAERSSELAPQELPPHAVENVADRTAQPQPTRPHPARRRGSVVQSNPLVVALAAAVAGAGLIVAIDREAVDTLNVQRIDRAEAPVLDGETSDPVWRNITPLVVTTNQGGNFDGTGETRIEIRAVHDDAFAYFLFVWDDPTRSLKQLPLKKTAEGWTLLHDGYERGDEHKYNEDKFSVLLTTLDSTLAGDHTFHASPQPLPDAPATRTGRGLHYTMDSNTYVDVWQWKATSTGAAGFMDDDHFGPPAEIAQAQAEGKLPYRGGFAPDPGTAGYADNFDIRGDDFKHVMPRRLPKDLAAMTAAMGPIDLDPDHSDSQQTRWFMTEAESTPYSPYADSRIPVGTVIPGAIVTGAFSGDRADVRCAARWASGRWALEVVRRLDTGSRYDVAIKSGVFMRVAAFDHSQIRHTRHVRPIRLKVE